MTPEIRRAALRAAAKVALVTAVGCSGAAPPPSNTSSTTPPPQQSCAQFLDSLGDREGKQGLAPDDPLASRADIYGAFADRAGRDTPRAHDCCVEDLAHGEKHRWACCAVLDNNPPAGASPSACSPWGPPCPPVMPGARATA